MSEYSELIKKFDKIRDYMRDFYVYGFNSREYYNTKSLRTYDNEKRRIESYLNDIMSFRQDDKGKTVFLSLDSALISQNPLYRPFKAKSFTKNDISLHFIILDILQDRENLTATEIADIISNEYFSFFEKSDILDLSTIRNKLKEYEKLGILISIKQGKSLLYSLNNTEINPNDYYDCLAYFSEISPVGVIGSYLLDSIDTKNDYISFKHHFITQALDSEVTFNILQAIHQKRNIEISSFHARSKRTSIEIITPIKILASVSGGRRYICGYNHRQQNFSNYRIDYIKSIKMLDEDYEFDSKRSHLEKILKYTWGVSFAKARNLEKVEITFNILPNEEFIVARINREGRGGTLSKINETTYKYEIKVYDTLEMLTWIRTFIGRIKSFKCSNKTTQKLFYEDLEKLYEIYAGDENDI